MIIVTGSAGFIGYHYAIKLLENGFEVLGLDNLNDYYDVTLKNTRLQSLNKYKNFSFIECDVAEPAIIKTLEPYKNEVTHLVHLAAQAGVRSSTKTALNYGHDNLMGQLIMLESATHMPHLRHFIYASSSSVYGDSEPVSSIDARADRPLSIYAATKRSGELMAHAYAHLYDFDITGLRFFTVYGPYGRPDMAYYSFAKNIVENKPINIHGEGLLKRDFTYIDDITDGLHRLFEQGNHGQPIYNLGSGRAYDVNELISIIEDNLSQKAVRVYSPKERTEVKSTLADISITKEVLGYQPKTNLNDGIKIFTKWFKDYHSK